MLGGEGHCRAAEGVVVPGVLGGGSGEEAFEVVLLDDLLDEVAGAVEEREKTVPVDGEQKRFVGRDEASSRGKRETAFSEAGEGERLDRVLLRELGNIDQFVNAGFVESVKPTGV